MPSHEVRPTPVSPEENLEGKTIVEAFARHNEEIITAMMESENISAERRTVVTSEVEGAPRDYFDQYYKDYPGDTFSAPLSIALTTKYPEEGAEYTQLDVAVDVEQPRPMDGDYFTALIAENDYYKTHGGYEGIDGRGNHYTISEQECRNLLIHFAIDSSQTADKKLGSVKTAATAPDVLMAASRALPLPDIISMVHAYYQHSPNSSFAATLEEASVGTTSRLSYDYTATSDTLQLESIDNETKEGVRIIFRSMQKYTRSVDETFGVLDPFPKAKTADKSADKGATATHDSYVAVELFHDDEAADVDTLRDLHFVDLGQLTSEQTEQIKTAAEALGISHLILTTSAAP